MNDPMYDGGVMVYLGDAILCVQCFPIVSYLIASARSYVGLFLVVVVKTVYFVATRFFEGCEKRCSYFPHVQSIHYDNLSKGCRKGHQKEEKLTSCVFYYIPPIKIRIQNLLTKLWKVC